MSKLKIEIKIVDGPWQWLGTLSAENLKVLCAVADALNTITEEQSND